VAAILVRLNISILLDLLPAFLVPLYLLHSFSEMSRRDATLFLFVSFLVSYSFEYLGVTTGFPFGRYSYSSFLEPFIGPVPAIIPMMWASLGYFCYMASSSPLTSSLMMVALDTALDPRVSPHLWKWLDGGVYFGVPPLNFLGWFVTSLAIFLSFRKVSAHTQRDSGRYLLFYLMFGSAQSFTDAIVGLYLPALLSFLFVVSLFLLSRYFFKRNKEMFKSSTTASYGDRRRT
jgi:putative membrane protein